MAPRLAASQYAQIRDMLVSGEFARWQIAKACNCSRDAVNRVSKNLRRFGSPCAPTRKDQRRFLTLPMLDALREHLLHHPELYLDEMAAFLRERFEIRVSHSTVCRVLQSIRWSKKVARRIAAERNADLRDWYLYYISAFRSYQLVYIDESGCDERAGFRRTAWAPRGVTPVQRRRFHRGRRYQILPAYSQDGILLARIFAGSTDSEVFERFIEELLPLCGRWPEPNSVLVMDNASFHRSDRIRQMCAQAGVLLVFLPPYSPDLNPIEEFFAQLKSFVKRTWDAYKTVTGASFHSFLHWCVEEVGRDKQSARGHFRSAGVSLTECVA